LFGDRHDLLMARSVRIGVVIMIVAILMAGSCGDAVAKFRKAHLHARSFRFESRAQLVSRQPVRLGPMRYYGGPKSPMWRGLVEN
jgi:hypothetical protein